MCDLLNLAYGVKQSSKILEIAHFWVHSLAHAAFSSPEADKKIGTLYHT